MKYISLILFAVALAWTWNLIHDQADISIETHNGIQEKVAELITETIKAKRPTATDILIENIWTEVLSGDRVKAHYRYSFKDKSEEGGSYTSQISGERILERQPDDGSGNDRWVLNQARNATDSIQFDDATIILAAPDGSTPVSTETETPAETPATPESHAPKETH
ncbi:MAG: hypothetical protein ACAH59_07845 [Pseudobdellovibrionaceae bacterium]